MLSRDSRLESYLGHRNDHDRCVLSFFRRVLKLEHFVDLRNDFGLADLIGDLTIEHAEQVHPSFN
jgi:hypothetical protein